MDSIALQTVTCALQTYAWRMQLRRRERSRVRPETLSMEAALCEARQRLAPAQAAPEADVRACSFGTPAS
ncbi:MAG: hypothetical protein ACR2GR_11755 [Rhodothermales bacterium]